MAASSSTDVVAGGAVSSDVVVAASSSRADQLPTRLTIPQTFIELLQDQVEREGPLMQYL